MTERMTSDTSVSVETDRRAFLLASAAAGLGAFVPGWAVPAEAPFGNPADVLFHMLVDVWEIDPAELDWDSFVDFRAFADAILEGL